MINNFIKKIIHKWLFTYKYYLICDTYAKAPLRAYKNDAGYDLFVLGSVLLPSGKVTNVSTGIYCKSCGVPAWIFLTGRSSTFLKHNLMVNDGIIDGDFTGELYINVFNPTDEDIWLYPGMRIGQMIVMPHTSINFVLSDKLEVKDGERGLRGFGSTGE